MAKDTRIGLIKLFLHVDVIIACVVVILLALHWRHNAGKEGIDRVCADLLAWSRISGTATCRDVLFEGIPEMAERLMENSLGIWALGGLAAVFSIWCLLGIRRTEGWTRVRSVQVTVWLSPFLFLFTYAIATGINRDAHLIYYPFLLLSFGICAIAAWLVNRLVLRRIMSGLTLMAYQAAVITFLVTPVMMFDRIGSIDSHDPIYKVFDLLHDMVVPITVFAFDCRESLLSDFPDKGYAVMGYALPSLLATFLYSLLALIALSRLQKRQESIDAALAGSRSMEELDAILEIKPELVAAQEGWSPLHSAVQEKKTELIRVMLANGADPNAPSDNGSTPLHYACWLQDRDIVKLLLDAHGDLCQKNGKGKTPLDLAQDDDFIAWLKEQSS